MTERMKIRKFAETRTRKVRPSAFSPFGFAYGLAAEMGSVAANAMKRISSVRPVAVHASPGIAHLDYTELIERIVQELREECSEFEDSCVAASESEIRVAGPVVTLVDELEGPHYGHQARASNRIVVVGSVGGGNSALVAQLNTMEESNEVVVHEAVVHNPGQAYIAASRIVANSTSGAVEAIPLSGRVSEKSAIDRLVEKAFDELLDEACRGTNSAAESLTHLSAIANRESSFDKDRLLAAVRTLAKSEPASRRRSSPWKALKTSSPPQVKVRIRPCEVADDSGISIGFARIQFGAPTPLPRIAGVLEIESHRVLDAVELEESERGILITKRMKGGGGLAAKSHGEMTLRFKFSSFAEKSAEFDNKSQNTETASESAEAVTPVVPPSLPVAELRLAEDSGYSPPEWPPAQRSCRTFDQIRKLGCDPVADRIRQDKGPVEGGFTDAFRSLCNRPRIQTRLSRTVH